MITRNAYAKLNLSLEVVGRRDDGYHDIVSLMQLVDLHDTLTFSPAEGEDITVDTDHPVLAAEGKANLVWRAARLLQETSRSKQGAKIELQKNIPLAAGLGGGSSDAAATLLGLAELWGLNFGTGEMRNLAAVLGSDVPFFLEGTTALVEGRGERVTPLPPPPPGWALLVCQPFRVDKKTERLYGTLERHDMSTGILTRQLAAAIRRGEFPSASLQYNAFERVAFRVFEGLDDVRQAIVRAGGDDVRLSGSGPTLYVLFPDAQEERARALHEAVQQEGYRTFLSRLMTNA
jgi:4-diphosphocytidyl-2-C-methyl-D-erythritol kinase